MKTNVKRKVITRPSKFEYWGGLVGRFIICGIIIAPFYYGWKALKWFYNTFLTEVYKSGNNDICGPGYYAWERTRFSWGKLAVIFVILFIITYLIFLR